VKGDEINESTEMITFMLIYDIFLHITSC